MSHGTGAMMKYSVYSGAPKFGQQPHCIGDHGCPILAGVIAAGEKNRFIRFRSTDAVHDAARNQRCGGFESARSVKRRLIAAGVGDGGGVEWSGSHDPV